MTISSTGWRGRRHRSTRPTSWNWAPVPGRPWPRSCPFTPVRWTIGLDESDAMLAEARMRLLGYNVRLLVADLSDPLPPGPFDLVVSVLAIHHLDGPGKAALFRRVAEVLSPGGRFVLGDAVIPTTPGGEVIPMEAGYDKPSTVAEQVEWLHDAGLVAVVRWEEDRDLGRWFTARSPTSRVPY